MKQRLVGASPGVGGLVFAWFGGVAIVRLTGATPVVLVLAAGAVLGVAAIVSGWVDAASSHRWRRAPSATATVGVDVPVDVCFTHDGRPSAAARPVWVELRVRNDRVAAGWSATSRDITPLTARFVERGAVSAIEVVVRSSGAPGAVWWSKRVTVEVDDFVVAPPAQRGDVRVERLVGDDDGEGLGRAGSVSGEIDGVRPWRDGDSERSVHWASTLRSGALVVHDHRQPVDRSAIVRASSRSGEPEAEAAAARWALEDALQAGERTYAAVDDAEPVLIADRSDAQRWAALVDLGPARCCHPSSHAGRIDCVATRTVRNPSRPLGLWLATGLELRRWCRW